MLPTGTPEIMVEIILANLIGMKKFIMTTPTTTKTKKLTTTTLTTMLSCYPKTLMKL